jgi:hypothetical protein
MYYCGAFIAFRYTMSFKDLDMCPVCDGDHGPADRCLPEHWTRTWDTLPPSRVFPSSDIPVVADTVNVQSTALCGDLFKPPGVSADVYELYREWERAKAGTHGTFTAGK